MPKTLVVNCSLNDAVSPPLFAAVEKFSSRTVVHFRDIRGDCAVGKDVDAVVLSGSEARIVKASDKAQFEGVEQLIRQCDMPIFGICYGHQLLCRTFGAEVGTLAKQVSNRFEDVKVIQSNGIFAGYKEGQTISLSENHYDYVLKDSLDDACFSLLADSASCEVEAVKHKTKPFYGVQFHPERITIQSETQPEGHRIIGNFYSNVIKR
ncbi:MAG TPA: gamma-glutamyl-gamma-aminobutyrate hydrolase family protein [Candidatus Binatia bacterium]|nr:gamma-glutamyl-gamma-aminobutyrate hydrolase family protein [Candidatus Binatia bacterium]